MRISFELDENDLKHFRLIMNEARQAARRLAPEDIVAAANNCSKRPRIPAHPVSSSNASKNCVS
jgi:hypothetical protein